MRQVAWMAAGSLGAWAMATVATRGTAGPELLLGMLAPLVVASVSWLLVERVYARDAAALTGVMVAAFGFKLVFFGGYVAVMLRVVGLRPVPFTVSFSSYFIALHMVEALFLRRLFAGPRA